MKIYGLTIVPSDRYILVTKEDGTKDWAETMTKLFTDKQDCIDYAVTEMKKTFASFDFEDEVDENERNESDFEADLKAGEDICIQGCSNHYCFEYFTQDLGNNIINRDDYVAAKLWNEEDLRQELKEQGYAGTDEQTEILIKSGYLKHLDEFTDEDWDVIRYAIDKCSDDLAKVSPDWIVTDIEWDIDKEDFDNEAEYEAVLLNVLPETVRIPYGECKVDDIADYLSDRYEYCIKSFYLSYENENKELNGRKTEWIKTDDLQWVKVESYNSSGNPIYNMIEVRDTGTAYIVVRGSIDVDDYDEDDILNYIKEYGYGSIEYVREEYPDNYIQIIAELIFESTSTMDLVGFGLFESEDKAEAYVEKELLR